MDAQPTAHDQPDDDAFAAIVARIDFDAETDESSSVPTSGHKPSRDQTPEASALGDPTVSGQQPPSAEPAESAPEKPAQAGSVMAEPELAVPPAPEPETSAITTRAAKAFAHLVWLAVAAGLVGQVVGWSAMFGQNVLSYVIAATLGAAFEFVMVAASSRGLVDIGRNAKAWQPVVFLGIGTACAAMAVVMILLHFGGPLPQFGLSAHDTQSIGWAAAACAALGYFSHVVVHLPDELANRAALQKWQVEAERVQAEIDERNRRRLADRDELERRQLAAQFATAAPQPEVPHSGSRTEPTTEPAPAVQQEPAATSTAKPKAPAKGMTKGNGGAGKGRFDRGTARDALGDEFDRLGPAEINRRMAALGYERVAPSTIRRWRQ